MKKDIATPVGILLVIFSFLLLNRTTMHEKKRKQFASAFLLI